LADFPKSRQVETGHKKPFTYSIKLGYPNFNAIDLIVIGQAT